MTTVLKLGGSVVTEKDDPETLDDDAVRAVADAIADANAATGPVTDLVVVHGGGSFGHHHASEHGVTATDGTRDATAAVKIHDAMGRLNDAVVGALHDRDVRALPVRPLSTACRDVGGDLSLATEQVATMLGEGFVPVLHGDVVAHVDRGVTVVSGDDLVVELADRLDADRVGLCSAVPGVFDADGEVLDRIERFDDVADALGESEATDVTGGMAAKVRKLLALAAPAQVFDRDELSAFLAGEAVGTTVAGRESPPDE